MSATGVLLWLDAAFSSHTQSDWDSLTPTDRDAPNQSFDQLVWCVWNNRLHTGHCSGSAQLSISSFWVRCRLELLAVPAPIGKLWVSVETAVKRCWDSCLKEECVCICVCLCLVSSLQYINFCFFIYWWRSWSGKQFFFCFFQHAVICFTFYLAYAVMHNISVPQKAQLADIRD